MERSHASLRITGSMLSREAIAQIQSQMRGLHDAQQRVSTGLRVHRASDDPVAAAGILQSSSGLRALEQYRGNLKSGQLRLATEDAALDQLSSTLIRARELAVSQVTDSATSVSREAAADEVGGLSDFARDLANTRINGVYVFGGQYADTAPYQGAVWDPLRPPSGTNRIEIGAGLTAETNHSAQEIFIDSDAVDAIEDLAIALRADDVPAAQAALARIDAAFDTVQGLVGDLGGRMTHFDHAASNLDSLEVTLKTFRSDLGDADLAEAVSDLVNRQGTLEAAMLANARILDVTLADYLR